MRCSSGRGGDWMATRTAAWSVSSMTSGMAIGVDEQGRQPLPWLGEALSRARAMDRAHALLV